MSELETKRGHAGAYPLCKKTFDQTYQYYFEKLETASASVL